MPNLELLNYVAKQLHNRINKEEIIGALILQGWRKEDVDEVFFQLEKISQNKSNKNKNIVLKCLFAAIIGVFIVVIGIFVLKNKNTEETESKTDQKEEIDLKKSDEKKAEDDSVIDGEIKSQNSNDNISQFCPTQILMSNGDPYEGPIDEIDENDEVIITRLDGLNLYGKLGVASKPTSVIPFGSKIKISKKGWVYYKPEVQYKSTGVWYFGKYQEQEGWFNGSYTLKKKDHDLFQENPYQNYENIAHEMLKVPREVPEDLIYYPDFFKGELPAPIKIHSPSNYNIGIDKVRAKVVYFKPKDFEINYQDSFKQNWLEDLDKIFKRIKLLHEREFSNDDVSDRQTLSVFNYDIYPKVLEGDFSDAEYALRWHDVSELHNLFINITKEIIEKMFVPDGEFYDENFISFSSDEYPILIVIIETKTSGGTAMEHRAIVSANIFKEGICAKKGVDVAEISCLEYFANITYHEILHTIGLKHEGWGDNRGNVNFWNDSLMGSENSFDFESNCVSKEVKELMIIKDKE